MKIAALISIPVITVIGCALLLHGSPAHYLIASAAGLVGFVLLLTAWIRRREAPTVFLSFVFCAGLFSASVGLSCFAGTLAYRFQIRTTQAKLAEVFSLLEQERRASGFYPGNIEEVIEKAGLPWLTRDSVIVISRSDYFSVRFRDPNAMIGDFFHYDSAARSWEYVQR